MLVYGEPITSFSGEYRFLSNFYPVSIRAIRDYSLPSLEHAYVTLKCGLDQYPEEMEKILWMTPGQIKRYGRTKPMIYDWDNVKLDVMRFLITIKFRNEELAKLLIATYPRPLIEGNTWGDKIWGAVQNEKGEWIGQNNLGKILMNERENLINDAS